MTQKNPENHNSQHGKNLETALVDAMLSLATALQTARNAKPPLEAPKTARLIKPDDQIPCPSSNELILDESFSASASPTLSSTLQSRWRPGGREVCLYVAGTKGTARISRLLQTRKGAFKGTVFKIGTASPKRLQRRIAELCNQQYGAVQESTYPPRLEPGFDMWQLRKIDGIERKKIPFFVKILPTAWQITLPGDMTIETFEAALRGGLESRSLRTWSQTPAGLAYLRERELDPAIFRRSTHYGMGLGARQSPSTELYLFDEKDDLPFLMALLSSIIERQVLGQAH